MDIVESNLNGFVSYIIRECNYGETPYKQYYTIIAANTVPDLLKCCNSLKHNVDTNKVVFIGLQRGSLGSMNISTGEMQGIIATVLGKNGVPAQVVKVDGIRLKGEDTIYDVFSILNRGNKKEI